MSLALITHLILSYRYPLIFILTIVEGPLIMMISGFYVSMNAFDIIPIYFTLMAGDLVGDIAWYCLGRYAGPAFIKKFGKFFSITEKNINLLEKFFHRHQNWILILSKITMGFGFAVVTLFTAGFVKISFKRYFLLNFFGEFIWTAILMGAGFFLGDLYISINNIFARVTIIAGFVIFFALLIGFGKYMKSVIEKRAAA